MKAVSVARGEERASVRETMIVDTHAPCKNHKHDTAGGVIDRGGLVRKRWESLFTGVIYLVQVRSEHGYIYLTKRSRP